MGPTVAVGVGGGKLGMLGMDGAYGSDVGLRDSKTVSRSKTGMMGMDEITLWRTGRRLEWTTVA